NIDLAQLRHDLFGFVLLLGHSNVLLRLNSLLQGGPLFRGQTNGVSLHKLNNLENYCSNIGVRPMCYK
ncbi:hypothetical protein LGM14_27105, partial [Burkholderia multivorans]|nr:hypothetical protein [Burkholderia multivorans]